MNNIFIDEYDYTPKRKIKPAYTKKILNETENTEQARKELLNKKIDYKNILGYKTKDNLKVKYDKDKELFIVFNNNDKIIYSCNESWREYNSNLYNLNYKYCYEDEI